MPPGRHALIHRDHVIEARTEPQLRFVTVAIAGLPLPGNSAEYPAMDLQ